jgi:type II secretory pathway component GspD/PulD (secretin)
MPVQISAAEIPTRDGSSGEPVTAISPDQQVVGLLLNVRPAFAVAGDIADDQTQVGGLQGLIAEPQTRRRTRREVL